MAHSGLRTTKFDEVDEQRLGSLVRTMALEIELLSEDNKQLRAAVAIYREALRRYAVKAGDRWVHEPERLQPSA